MSGPELAGVTGPAQHRAAYGVRDPRQFRRGGVGVVYEAVLLMDRHSAAAGSRVALKLLTGIDASRFAKLSMRGALLREHPHPRMAAHIESFTGPPLTLDDVEEEDCDLFYSVHEWVDGVVLADKVPDASPQHLVDWLADVAEALDHLHSLPDGGFAHRDVHARNVVVTPDGRAKLIDFDTLLWGEHDDTVLTNLHSLAGQEQSPGTKGAQARDRAMLALALLRALARETSSESSMSDIALRSLETLKSGNVDAVGLVDALLGCVRRPPETAAEVIAAARKHLQVGQERGRVRRTTRRWRRDRQDRSELAAVLGTSSSGGRQRVRLLIAVGGAVAASLLTFVVVVRPFESTPDATSQVPELVDSIAFRAKYVAAGGAKTCAVSSVAREVFCWGAFEAFQDGDPNLGEPTRDPTRVEGLGYGAEALSVSSSHACALDDEETVRCWGWNSFGQLGDGTRIGHADSVAVRGLVGVRQVDVGDQSSCAIDASRQVLCWGLLHGLFNPAFETKSSTRPVAIPGATAASDLALGSEHACLIREGRVYCWGVASPSIGIPYEAAPVRGVANPTLIEGLKNVKEIDADGGTTCALTHTGAVHCWGRAVWSTSEDGRNRDSSSPRHITALGISRNIAVGSEHLCSITRTKQVICVGSNASGQRGLNTRSQAVGPEPVVGLEAAASLASSGDHTCALRAAETLACWGSAASGQIGDGEKQLFQLLPATVVVPAPLSTWDLESGGYGPISVGDSIRDLTQTGLVTAETPDGNCNFRWFGSEGMSLAGVRLEFREDDRDDLDSIFVGDARDSVYPPITTPEGIRVGSTIDELRAAYGDLARRRFEAEGAFTTLIKFGPKGALLFVLDEATEELVVAMAAVKGTSMEDIQPDIYLGC